MEPAAAGAELYRQYMSAHDAWVADHDVRHPSFDTKSWRQTARDAGTLRDPAQDDNSGLGPKELERQDHGTSDEPATSNMDPQAVDDPPEFPGKPANPVNRNNPPAQDSRPMRADEVARMHRQTVVDISTTEYESDGITLRPRRCRF
jgi:hypothetical protein